MIKIVIAGALALALIGCVSSRKSENEYFGQLSGYLAKNQQNR